jgi:hypothetical protein
MPNAPVAAAAEGLPKFTYIGGLLPLDLSALTIAEAIRAYDALWLAQEAAAAACAYAQACDERLGLLEDMHERLCDDAQRLAEHVRASEPSATEQHERGLFLIRRAVESGENVLGIAALAATLAAEQGRNRH